MKNARVQRARVHCLAIPRTLVARFASPGLLSGKLKGTEALASAGSPAISRAASRADSSWASFSALRVASPVAPPAPPAILAESDLPPRDAGNTWSGTPLSPAQPPDPSNHPPDACHEGQRQERQKPPEVRTWADEGAFHFQVRAGETTLRFRSTELDFAGASLDILTPGNESAGLLAGLPFFLERMRLHGIDGVSLNGRRLAIRERA